MAILNIGSARDVTGEVNDEAQQNPAEAGYAGSYSTVDFLAHLRLCLIASKLL